MNWFVSEAAPVHCQVLMVVSEGVNLFLSLQVNRSADEEPKQMPSAKSDSINLQFDCLS